MKSLPESSDPAGIFNALLAAEYRAWWTYSTGAQIVMGPARTVIAAEYMAHANEELGHAYTLCELMQERGIVVVTNLVDIARMSGAASALPVTSDATLALNRSLESQAIADYTLAIRRLEGDPAAVQALTEILGVEQQHLHDLEQLSSEIVKGVKRGTIPPLRLEPHVKAGEGHVLPLTANERRMAKAMASVFTMQLEAALKWIDDHAEQFGRKAGEPFNGNVLGGEWDQVIAKMTGRHVREAIVAGAGKGRERLPQNAGKAIARVKALGQKVAVLDDYDQYIERAEFGDFVRQHTFRFARAVNAKTQQDLRDTISAAMDDGEPVARVQSRVSKLFGDYEGYRTERIARTETARAMESGSRKVYEDSGVVGKLKWLASGDACEFCREIDGMTVDLGDKFFHKGATLTAQWGGATHTMSLDYEDIFGPPLHPNCRCDAIPIGKTEEE